MPPTPADPASSETSRDLPHVTIAQANAITLAEALTLAHDMGIPVGKSTLQRWVANTHEARVRMAQFRWWAKLAIAKVGNGR